MKTMIVYRRHARRWIGVIAFGTCVLAGGFSNNPASALTALRTPKITSVEVSATSVHVSFTPIHAETHYSLRIFRRATLVASSTTCIPSRCQFNGLQPSTTYFVTVAAHADSAHYSDSAESPRVKFSTTSLTISSAAPQAGWKVLVSSPLGVMVDERNFTTDGLDFVAVRFRYATTAFRLHVGSADPPGAAALTPLDASSRVSAQELSLGVLGVFNSGFRSSDHAGMMVDGRVLEPMVPGDATLVISNSGQVSFGVWGVDLPRRGSSVIEYRQNLPPLGDGGVPTPLASTPYWGDWGGVWELNPHEPRSSLGVDGHGDVLYVATTQGAMPIDLARALVAAGARFAMELDINPFWPSLGVTDAAHSRTPHFVFTLPGEQKEPSAYFSGSTRDFFVAVAQPALSDCHVESPPPGTSPQAEPMGVAGNGCIGAQP